MIVDEDTLLMGLRDWWKIWYCPKRSAKREDVGEKPIVVMRQLTDRFHKIRNAKMGLYYTQEN